MFATLGEREVPLGCSAWEGEGRKQSEGGAFSVRVVGDFSHHCNNPEGEYAGVSSDEKRLWGCVTRRSCSSFTTALARGLCLSWALHGPTHHAWLSSLTWVSLLCSKRGCKVR